MVVEWGLRFSQCSLVVIGAGPPCQGVSGRSCLFVHVSRVRDLVKRHFTWAAVHVLMESVSSMDEAVMSDDFGSQPVHIDAGTLTWCNRPRLYWTTWELCEGPGASCNAGVEPVSWTLVGQQPVDQYLEAGWSKVSLDQSFPTFTTSRPAARPGRKPAGVVQCQEHELRRWREDWHRFPPYQYMDRHGVVDKRGNVRVPSISEREVLFVSLSITLRTASQRARRRKLAVRTSA